MTISDERIDQMTHDIFGSIDTLAEICWQGAEDRGFHEEYDQLLAAIDAASTEEEKQTAQTNLRNYDVSKLMLMVSEVVEAMDELRSGHDVTETYYPTKLPIPEGQKLPLELAHHQNQPHKPEGVPSEVADLIIRALEWSRTRRIPIGDIIREKLAYNETRGYRHGKKF